MENNDNTQWLWPELPEQPIGIHPELWDLLRELRSIRNRYYRVINSLDLDDDIRLNPVSDLFTDLECLFMADMSDVISAKVFE